MAAVAETNPAAPIVLLVESGADVPAAARQALGIEVVPMHVTLGGETFDDGAVPCARMLDACAQTGSVPTTSGCTPHDFTVVFDRIHASRPDAHILHLAFVYSHGLADSIRASADARAREEGFEEVEWVETGCVIASHSGPGSFGVAAFTRE